MRKISIIVLTTLCLFAGPASAQVLRSGNVFADIPTRVPVRRRSA
jgi:hypothetical protein